MPGRTTEKERHITENLVSLLLFLACPLGMGLMMWLMMRGHRGRSAQMQQLPTEPAVTGPSSTTASSADRLGQLRVQLAEVQAQQMLIAGQITQLSAEDRPVEPPTLPAPGRP